MNSDTWVDPFAALFDACLDCGRREGSGDCPSCAAPETPAPPIPELLGARIPAHAGGWTATIIGVGPDPEIEILPDHGTKQVRARDQLAVDPVILTSGRDRGERLLIAAFHWDLPPTASGVLLSAAADAIQDAGRSQQLRFAERAYAMGQPDLATELDLRTLTVAWLTAQRQILVNELQAAAETLVEIPPGHFPARLGVWAMAAEGMQKAVSSQVLDHLDAFMGTCPAQDIAVEIVRHALHGGNPDSATNRLRESMPELAERLTARVETAGETLASRLLRTLRRDPDQLASHPELLAHAAPALLDDLIADGVIDMSWLDLRLPPPVEQYIAARLDPSRLDNDVLVAYGLHEERARRAVRNGRQLPKDLPDAIVDRYRALEGAAAAKTDPGQAIEALDIDPRLRPELHAALAQPEQLPSDRLLSSAPARLVLGRVAVKSLALEGLDRGSLTTSQQRFVGTVALERSRRALYAWDYDRTTGHAKDALRLCDDEPIRDEALNLIACASWQLGNDDAAIRALETALEGDYTFALQANIGVVAQELEPDVAGKHLSRLITDAPTLQLRVEAAKRTLAIWGTQELPDQQDDDLPAELARSLRPLLDEPIDPADFRLFARLLSDHDAAWMAGFSKRSSSAGAESPAGELFSARARSIDEYVKALSRLIRLHDAESWLSEERNRFVAAIRAELVSDEPHMGAVSLAELMLFQSLPMGLDDEILLGSLTARAVAFALIDDEGGEPADRFLDRLEASARRVDELDEDERELVDFAVRWAYDALTRAYLVSRWKQLREAADFHDQMLAEILTAARNRHNRQVAERASSGIQEFTRDTRTLMRRLRPHVDDELGEHVDQLLETCDQLEESARRQLRM